MKALFAVAILLAACTRSPGEQSRADAPGEPSAQAPQAPHDQGRSGTPGSSPRTAAGKVENTAETLLARAPRLVAVEVVDLDSQRAVATFSETQLEAVRKALTTAEPRDSFVNTTPPWSVALRFQADGATVTAILVGERTLRVNPRKPFSPAWASESGEPIHGVRDIALDETLYDLLAEELGPPSKEYRPARPIDLGDL